MRNLKWIVQYTGSFIFISLKEYWLSNYKFANLEGKWTYRSYHNNPDSSADDRWGIYSLSLKQDKEGRLSGKLDSGDPSDQYAVEGKLHHEGTHNDPAQDGCFNIQMVSSGSTKQTEGHVYKYQGRLIPKWSEGKNQIPSFVGTVIRTKFPGNPSQEGIVGCFIATKNAK
jgi:hypothetical protein